MWFLPSMLVAAATAATTPASPFFPQAWFWCRDSEQPLLVSLSSSRCPHGTFPGTPRSLGYLIPGDTLVMPPTLANTKRTHTAMPRPLPAPTNCFPRPR